MNKHLIAFLSVFSLGVVLSIYYAIIPMNNSENQEVAASVSPSSVSYSPELYFSALISQRKENHDKIVSDYNEIIVSEAYSKEEKEVALSSLEKENNTYALELTIDRNLATVGYLYSITKIKETEKSVSIIIYQDQNGQKIDKVEIFYLTLNTLNDNSYDVSLVIHS